MAKGTELAVGYVSLELADKDLGKQVKAELEGTGKYGDAAGKDIGKKMVAALNGETRNIGRNTGQEFAKQLGASIKAGESDVRRSVSQSMKSASGIAGNCEGSRRARCSGGAGGWGRGFGRRPLGRHGYLTSRALETSRLLGSPCDREGREPMAMPVIRVFAGQAWDMRLMGGIQGTRRVPRSLRRQVRVIYISLARALAVSVQVKRNKAVAVFLQAVPTGGL